MNQVRHERRAGQRFDFQIPVSLRVAGSHREGHGFTQNLSAKGISFCTEMALAEGEMLEVTLVMPSEITMAESMPLRCRGKVLRASPSGVPIKCVAAVHLEHYEYLTHDSGLLARRAASQTPVCEQDSTVLAP